MSGEQQQSMTPVTVGWTMPKTSTVYAATSNVVVLVILYGLIVSPPFTLQAHAVAGVSFLGAIFVRLCAIHQTLRGR